MVQVEETIPGRKWVVQHNEIVYCVVNILVVNVSRDTFFQIFSNQALDAYCVLDPGTLMLARM